MIVVEDPLGGRHLYRVTSRRAFPKSDLPAELFTATGPPHLVLVTCGGASTRQPVVTPTMSSSPDPA